MSALRGRRKKGRGSLHANLQRDRFAPMKVMTTKPGTVSRGGL